MSQAISPSVNKSYGLARTCRVWRFPRSSVYEARRRSAEGGERLPKRRGPTGAGSDQELLGRIQAVLEDSPWVGEGHRKVWARLRAAGVRTSRRRVLRLMRDAGLLAPTRVGRPHGPRAHDGNIIPNRPDELWGTDATATMTGEGMATIFVLIDHCTAECLGIHAALRGTRFEAVDPLRQAVRSRFGQYEQSIAEGLGLRLRHDHGSQFVSHYFQAELRFLGIESSPAYVREPEGNGCAERFIRTLKEQLLWLQQFDTVEELLSALQAFKDRYNREWLIERHGWISPDQCRRQLATEAAA